MKFIFSANCEETLDIMLDVFDHYCVPRKIKSNSKYICGYRQVDYTIEIDVPPEFYDKLYKIIYGKLTTRGFLEYCYDMPSYEKEDNEHFVFEPFSYPQDNLANKINSTVDKVKNVFKNLTKDLSYKRMSINDFPKQIKEDILHALSLQNIDVKDCKLFGKIHNNGNIDVKIEY